MALLLEIEYLSGVCFAAIGQDSPTPDWPPQPDRIFSALVATWAVRGEDAQEAQALEWLEKLEPPRIRASGAEPRTAATVFVPPNDPRSDKQKHARGVLPAFRSRQARRFPATRPLDPVVRLLWSDAAPGDGTLAALKRLAHDTAYVGHSASLTCCRFLHDPSALRQDGAELPKRRIYAGRFAELRRDFDRGRRSSVGAPVAPPAAPKKEPGNTFSGRWLLLEHVDGDMPDLRACALVAKTMRDALLGGYRRIGLGDCIPEIVSGHAPDGTPTRAPHLAVVPLAFAGFPYADGHVMGFALVPPTDSALLDDKQDEGKLFLNALRALRKHESDGRKTLKLWLSGDENSIALAPTLEPPPGKRSLDPSLYVDAARTFATVTPIVLDRHLKEKGEERESEIARQIVAACRNIGLPEPEEVVADKHSAIEGAPSAYPSGRSPAWMRWRLPRALASRPLTHAVIRFAEPVEGPVILGAGRFTGLGLCRPLDSKAR